MCDASAANFFRRQSTAAGQGISFLQNVLRGAASLRHVRRRAIISTLLSWEH